MKTMSAIYQKVRHRLNDDWAFGNDMDARPWDFQAEECALRTCVDRFNNRRYSNTAFDPEFDPDEYIGNRWGIIRVQGEPEEVVLRFDAEVGRRVAEESWHKSQQTEILPDDRVIFRLHLILTPEFISWLLYYGSGLEVVAPGWLRERVAEEHPGFMEELRGAVAADARAGRKK